MSLSRSVAPPAEAQQLQAERLRLGLEQSKRVLLPYAVAEFVIAWVTIELGQGHALWVYLPYMAVVVNGRTHLLQWMQQQARYSQTDLMRAMSLSPMMIAAGYAGLALVLFQQPIQPTHYLFSMILVGAAAGAVAPAAGDVRGYLAYALVLGIGHAAAWLMAGGWSAGLPALLMLVLLGSLANYVRDQGQAQIALIRTNARLSEAHAAAERASEARTRFFAAASHDLRQPLTALAYNVATVEALAQLHGDAQLGRVGQGLRRSLGESQVLLNSLLEISQLDAGAVDIARQPFNLGELVQSVTQSLRPLATERGLSLWAELPAQPCWVRGDAGLLRRVLSNLVGNAIKFTLKGDVRLDVSTRGQDAWVAIKDTGPGIPRELQERVFEEFFQVGNPARDRHQGLGLGLAIVQRLAHLMSVPLTLESEPGQGCCFRLKLPIVAAPTQAGLTDGAPSHAATEGVTGTALRVMLVDDEAPIREALGLYLDTLGWQLLAAADGDAALALWQAQGPIDALVLDFRLGDGETGLDVLKRLRDAGCQAPAWLITGDTAPERIQAAREAGLPVLYKPVEGRELVAAIMAKVSGAASG
jgi:signal transduction histidine kinase/CheY-like chemotaxis protein